MSHGYPFPCTVKNNKVTARANAFWKACKEKVDATPGLTWHYSGVHGVAPV